MYKSIKLLESHLNLDLYEISTYILLTRIFHILLIT